MKLNSNLKKKAIETTNVLNSFFEDEILVPDPKTGFRESFGYIRRGVPGYDETDPETMKRHISAKAFERDCWPRVEKPIDGVYNCLIWHILYENSVTDYKSSFQIPIGYQFNHDLKGKPDPKKIVSRLEEIIRKPFFIDSQYRRADKKENTFSSIDETIGCLREKISKLDYLRRENAKKQLPQINEKGLSEDYFNEIAVLYLAVQHYIKTGDNRLLKKNYPIRKYEERFPADEYNGVITDQNKESVKGINGSVKKLNHLIEKDSKDLKQYGWLIDDITSIIRH
ncbi:hypothetical protein GF336_06435 [Candidatus Woesearchaeota archaeon]|nr:hypothetical protein [Candidatus Woesearchaeota archaeon]